MPLYEYRCLECGDETEVLQKVSERPKRTCTKCKGKLEKLISRASFQLKGGGWFAQGYTGGSGGRGSGGSSSGGSSAGGGESGGGSTGGGSTKKGGGTSATAV